jgi:hypothetical protein
VLSINDLGRCCLSRWMLFHKRTVRTKFDIYVVVTITGSIPLVSLNIALFSPWYSWKIAGVTKTNQSLTHSLTRYLYWWTISSRWYHTQSSQCLCPYDVFFSLLTHIGLQQVLAIWVTLHVSNKKQELLAFTGTWVPWFPGLIGGIRVAHIFTFLCCGLCFAVCLCNVSCAQFRLLFCAPSDSSFSGLSILDWPFGFL